MKAIERIIVKVIIVQFLFLLLAQVFLHKMNLFPELREITQYEGVSENNFTNFLETFHNLE